MYIKAHFTLPINCMGTGEKGDDYKYLFNPFHIF